MLQERDARLFQRAVGIVFRKETDKTQKPGSRLSRNCVPISTLLEEREQIIIFIDKLP